MRHRHAYILLALTFRRRDYVTFVISWAVLGEPIRWYHAVGATVLIAGVVLTTKR